jgi:hypothetical protein
MKPHRTDGVSLGFGIIFLLIAGWWALAKIFTLTLPAVGWLVAGALILFGVVGLLGALRSGRRPADPVPIQAEAGPPDDAPGSDLPPGMHADIVRELMEEPKIPDSPVREKHADDSVK